MGDLFAEAADLAVAQGRSEEGWRWLERGRARAFRDLLAMRDWRFSREVPEDLYREIRQLAVAYEATQAELAMAKDEAVPLPRARLVDLLIQRARLERRIAATAPALAGFERSAVADLPAARALLPPGAALLSFSLGLDQTQLFVVRKDRDLAVFPLAAGRRELTERVEALRAALREPNPTNAALLGRDLFELLLAPAEPALAGVDHLVISPDGPLQALPFAALRTTSGWLVERWSLQIVASATIHIESLRRAPSADSAGKIPLVAIGDPRYAPDTRLRPLPASRQEVLDVAALVSGARLLLGAEATEQAVLDLAPRARRLHLAAHGVLDPRRPLDSAIVLASPSPGAGGSPNGRLQAWEIFESLRLDADLVTLSACDGGLGPEIRSDGLVGLVRAFQFAGARTVLAAVAPVSDASTASLMTRFYRHLTLGQPPSRALRAAQLEMIHGPEGVESHPHRWAAFQVYGAGR